MSSRSTSDAPEHDLVYRAAFNGNLTHWIGADPRVALRIMALVEAIRRDPFRGIGKPEPLKGEGPNIWSRRITAEHRLVYQVEHQRLVFLRARGHYSS